MNAVAQNTIDKIDATFLYIFGISAAMLVGITLCMIWFAIRYHKSRHPRPMSDSKGHPLIETIWTVVPTLIVLSMFWYGWTSYANLRDIPEDALKVTARGRMWSWVFEYDNGLSSDRMRVPTGRAVEVRIESDDVLHSFYMPAFRIKRDAVPGMSTRIWFRPQEDGEYDIFCAEYCGVQHSTMISVAEAMPQEDFDRWYSQKQQAPKDATALLEKHGCLGCHSLDGDVGVGPTFQNFADRERTVILPDGSKRTLTPDREYVRRSILEPKAELVEHLPAIMPSYQGRIPEGELEQIIDWLLGQGQQEKERVDGRELFESKGCGGCHSVDGSPKVGPTLRGLFGRTLKVQTGKEVRTITADTEYVKRSIVEPKADLVEDYPPIMPAFKDLSAAELEALVDYIRSLGEVDRP